MVESANLQLEKTEFPVFSRCYGKISKFPVFSLTEFLLTIFLFSMCSGDPEVATLFHTEYPPPPRFRSVFDSQSGLVVCGRVVPPVGLWKGGSHVACPLYKKL